MERGREKWRQDKEKDKGERGKEYIQGGRIEQD
jgi:hypothetical protein